MPKKYKNIFDQLLKNSRRKGGCLESTYKVHKLRKPAFFTHKNKLLSVPREAYKWYHGEIPEGMLVCHHCDNPLCFRKKHLFLGTATDNMQDMIKKGRDNNWGARKHSKETMSQVKKLREEGFSCFQIAKKLNINVPGIAAYCTRHKIKKGNPQPKDRKFSISLKIDIEKYRLEGFSDADIYRKLGMSESTFYRMMKGTK